MPRRKNYQVSQNRAAQVPAEFDRLDRPIPCLDDAYIDIQTLLGPNARFSGTTRVLNLRNWLGRGIDAWVCTTGFCLKAMLLSGARTTQSVVNYYAHTKYLFDYLTKVLQTPAAFAPESPRDLSPLHVEHFISWLQRLAQADGWTINSTRGAYKSTKAVLVEMFAQGFISGEPSRFFRRGALAWRSGESRHTSLSDAEQDRLAHAIKSDLVAVHHERLTLAQGAVQGLRLLLVAHRQGLNPTPLLEMRRDALLPGFLPGTIRIRTFKYRNRRISSSLGCHAQDAQTQQSIESAAEQDLFFDLSEGAVLQQAISSTRDLVDEASAALKDRIWLYRDSSRPATGRITCLNPSTLERAITGVIQRHDLRGDDGEPLRLNLSRLRKSRFDRALRIADGDMAVTANLMGNTSRVSGRDYPSMNDARKSEAAGFMNEDFTALMRPESGSRDTRELRPVQVQPYKATNGRAHIAAPMSTPVSGCMDSINGEHSPHDGRSHCDRYVMCLFCSSFAIVGTVDELWRLLSFQVFAKAELDYLDETLGEQRTTDDLLEDLRDRYRVAIPYVDDITRRQFATSRVVEARAKTLVDLHPYWKHQMTMSRRARSRTPTHGHPAAVDQDKIKMEERIAKP